MRSEQLYIYVCINIYIYTTVQDIPIFDSLLLKVGGDSAVAAAHRSFSTSSVVLPATTAKRRRVCEVWKLGRAAFKAAALATLSSDSKLLKLLELSLD